MNRTRDPDISFELLVISAFATPIITAGIILITLINIINTKFKFLKDKWYALAGFIISIIALGIYASIWILPWIHDLFGV